MSAGNLSDALSSADPSSLHVVALPDFFVDHFVEAPRLDQFEEAVRRIHAQGGGNLTGMPQRFASGGNAANTCLGLAALGVKAHLVTRTDPFGAAFLRDKLGRAGVDLSAVREDGELAITTALEFDEPELGRRNVMLSASGSVARFGPDDLTASNATLIEACDAVLVANWSQNVSAGTSLARHVVALAAKAGALAYVDTGDPSHRSAADVDDLFESVLSSRDLGVLALNENELRHYDPGSRKNPEASRAMNDPEALLERGRRLRKAVSCRVDLHTSAFAASFGEDEVATIPSFRVDARRATGAGDAWNAGNLLGYLLNLVPEDRLILANAVAALYVSSPDARHPSLAEVRAFLERVERS